MGILRLLPPFFIVFKAIPRFLLSNPYPSAQINVQSQYRRVLVQISSAQTRISSAPSLTNIPASPTSPTSTTSSDDLSVTYLAITVAKITTSLVVTGILVAASAHHRRWRYTGWQHCT
jgi:hypothetical protein